MKKVKMVLRELHRSENGLARMLLTIADRHRVDHEVFHVARDIAQWSQIHVHEIAEVGRNHGLRLDPVPTGGAPAVVERLAQRTSVLLGRRPEPGLMLLADLRRLHRKAAGVSLDWELLGQSAQATQRRDLLELSQRCHPQTLRQMRWANAQLKQVAPQVLAS
ncbi:hypothetical protein [Pseudonocardia nigra]|uniref:hypothetical protein n=1 Tax=Pseudonocardia nigra TaxID=1921578 RepID=UPI001C5D300E|nr:hypothetical protein [Pseudonocardia nigra]